MIKLSKMFIIIGILCSIIWTNHSVALATSWVDLIPEEVEESAEVIVLGTYDFSKEPKRSSSIFQGYPFNVSAVYKGDAEKTITVGIDDYDVAWASEFQETGGTFLAFLQNVEEGDFLVPVAGPNGMIQVSNNKVSNNNKEKQEFYEAILKGKAKDPEQNNSDNEMTKSENIYLWLIPVIAVVIILFLYIYRRLTSGKRPAE